MLHKPEANARQAAAAAQAELAKQKAEMLQQLDTEVLQAQVSIEEWRNTSLQQADQAKTTRETELVSLEQQWKEDYQKNLKTINTQYEDQITKLNTERERLVKKFKEQCTESTKILQQVTIGSKTKSIAIQELCSNMRKTVRSANLGLRRSYAQLINSSTAKDQKISLYSHLAAWLNTLEKDNQLTQCQHEIYKTFLLTTCFYDVDLTTKNASIVHTDLQTLLKSTYHKQTSSLDRSYIADLANNTNKYQNQQKAIDDFRQYWGQKEQELTTLHQQEMEELRCRKNQQEAELIKTLNNALETFSSERSKVIANHNKACEEIANHYTTQTTLIDAQKTTQIAQINTDHSQQVGIISSKLTQALNEINNNLERTFKEIERKERINAINLIVIAPLALAGAYFAPVLFAAAGATTIAAIQTSLLTTGLGSLVSGLNNKGRFGINVVFPIDNGVDHNISNPNPKKVPTNSANLTQQETFNLEQFKASYTETVNKILTNKIEIENKLRHPLLKSMSSMFGISPKRETIPAIAQWNRTLKKDNRSDLLVVKPYSDQGYKFTALDFRWLNMQSQNWKLQNLDLGVTMQQAIFSGGEGSRFYIIIPKTTLPTFQHRVYSPKSRADIYRFSPAAGSSSLEQVQPFSTKAISNPSWTNSILNFPGNLLFGQMAYADSLPTYSTSSLPSGTNSYLDVGFGEKLLILTGGGMKHVWSGFKQGYYMAGEKLDLLAPGTAANYTNKRNQELRLYNSTPVGQSELRPCLEFGTEMLVYSIIPGAAFGRIGLVANAALSGGVIGGLQFVEDGQASSRLVNASAGAVVGAGVGVAVNKVGGSLLKLYDARQTRKFNQHSATSNFSRGISETKIVSSPNLRVDTPKLPSSSSSIPTASSSTSTQISRETKRLIGKTDRYKSELFERAGKTKDQTTLNAAKIELQGKQIDLAIEKAVVFDHVTKVEAAQNGLLKHLKDINARLSHPECSMVERNALETELSKASKLLDHTEQFVPRTSTPQPPNYPKPRAT